MSRSSELLKAAAGALEDGRGPLHNSFLCEHEVTLDECYSLAEHLATGARLIAWAMENPKQAAVFASSGSAGMALHTVTELLAKVNLRTAEAGPREGDVAECGYCTTRITFLGGSWTADDGTTCCLNTGIAPFVPHEPQEASMTLAGRITAVLTGTGFRPYADMPDTATHHTGPFFCVTEGVGVTISVVWVDATDAERGVMLTRYASRLHEIGLNAERRDGHLYVSEG